LIKNNILRQSKNYNNHFENSNFWGMWPLGHVGHMTYSFIYAVHFNGDSMISSAHKFCR
jgi:hypothetical protein